MEENEDAKQYLPVRVNGVECRALVDSGNTWRTAISYQFLKALGLDETDLQPMKDAPNISTAKKGGYLTCLGETKTNLHLNLGGGSTRFKFRPVVIKDFNMSLNLGSTFLRKHQIDQLHSKDCIRVQGRTYPMFTSREYGSIGSVQHKPLTAEVQTSGKHSIKPQKAQLINLKAPKEYQDGDEVMIEGSFDFMGLSDLHPIRGAISRVQNGRIIASVMNTGGEEIEIESGTPFGTVELACQEGIMEMHPWREIIPHIKEHQKELEKTEAQPATGEEDWMRGPTNLKNLARRTRELMIRFKLDKSPHLQKMEDLERVMKLLLKYWEIFSFDGNFGKSNWIEHDIKVTKDKPINQKIRPINPALEESLKKQIDEWLKHGVIEETSSPWNSALVPVKKKNGKIRWCVDYRALNEITERDAHPIGNIEDNLNRLSGSKIFSTLDGCGAFHVVPLTKEAQAKTAFSTPWSQYCFKYLPFGLSNGPATYARLVQMVLQGLPAEMAIPYLDDTICHSTTIPGHLEALEKVFLAYQKAGLMLQPSKCHFFQQETDYLGHKVSSKGIQPNEDHLSSIKDWKVPNTRTRLRAFLGKVGYYRKFIPNFSKRAKPLNDRMTEDNGLKDKEEHQPTKEEIAAFEDLRNELLQKPILAYPDFKSNEPFILDTDWSGVNAAIGGVLSQKQGGKERVIAYGAKRLSKSQQNYAPSTGELFAAMHFVQHWKYYLQHRKFILRTDHESLCHIKTWEPPKGAVGRWIETITNYDFDVVYRPGPKHGNADGLSRCEHLPPGGPETETDELIMSVFKKKEEKKANEFRKLQENDYILKEVREWVRSAKTPSREEIRSSEPEKQLYAAWLPLLSIGENDLLYVDRTSERNGKVVLALPQSSIRGAIWKAHQELGHKGPEPTCTLLQQRVFFMDMLGRVRETLKKCTECSVKTKPSSKGQKDILHSHQEGYPFQTISIDFVGPLPRSNTGFQYLLTVRDLFTRWMEAYPCRDMTTETVVKKLNQELFTRFGLPERIHSDNGTQFASEEMERLAKELGIILTKSPPYNPKSNPVERAHRDLETILIAMTKGKPGKWVECLPAALFAMRIAECRSTGYSPFYLMFGRHPRCELDLIYPLPHQITKSPDGYAETVRANIQEAMKCARQQQDLTIRRQSKYYTGKLPTFTEGQLVWLFHPVLKQSQSKKLAVQWTGPWKIDIVHNTLTYTLKGRRKDGKILKEAVTIDRIRPYTGRITITPENPIPMPGDPFVNVCVQKKTTSNYKEFQPERVEESNDSRAETGLLDEPDLLQEDSVNIQGDWTPKREIAKKSPVDELNNGRITRSKSKRHSPNANDI